MKMNLFPSLTCLVIGAACSLTCVSAAELVTNGGFETGTLSSWTQTNLSFSGVSTASSNVAVHSGLYAGFFGPTSLGSISQLLNTTPGETYTISYWLYNQGGTPNQFFASWNNSPIAASTLTNVAAFSAYTNYSFSVVATAATTPVSFSFLQVPNFWNLDDVSVTVSAAPPVSTPDQGASVALFGIALIGLGVLAAGFGDTIAPKRTTVRCRVE